MRHSISQRVSEMLEDFPIFAHWIALLCTLPLYDYVILAAIRSGVIGEWRASSFYAFASLLYGFPEVLLIAVHGLLSRYTRIGYVAFGLFVVASLVFVFLNSFFLGCHPIWEGRGRCT